RGYQSEYDRFVLRNETQRREIAGARRVIFEEIKRNFERIEQPVGHVLIAAFGVPVASSVAATQMHSNAQRLWRSSQHAVCDVDVSVDQLAPVITACCQRRLHIGIAELREGGFVDLHIAAAGPFKHVQFLGEGFNRVIPELSDVPISMGKHRFMTASEMQRTRSRDCDLRQQRGSILEEIKIVDIDWMGPTHTTIDSGYRLRPAPATTLGTLRSRTRDGVDAEVPELLVE